MPKGGKRKGAGRPYSVWGKSKVTRVPLIWWDEFQKWLKEKKESGKDE